MTENPSLRIVSTTTINSTISKSFLFPITKTTTANNNNNKIIF